MIKAVLFDLDDTLLDFRPAEAQRAYRIGAERTHQYLRDRGLPVADFQRFYRTHCETGSWNKLLARFTGRERSVRHLFKKLCLDLKLQRDEISMSRLAWLWYEPLARTATVALDVIPTLTAFRDADVRLGVVCNTPLQGEVIDRHLEMENLLEFFRVRIYSSDVAFRKPDRRIFQAALNELQLRPAEAIYVGDVARTDIVGAHRTGMRAVLRQKRRDEKRRGRADFVISSLAELLQIPELRQQLALAEGKNFKQPLRPAAARSPVA